MALKDTWVNKVDNVDDVSAKDINDIADSVIELEEQMEEQSENIVQTTGDSKKAIMSQKATTDAIKESAGQLEKEIAEINVQIENIKTDVENKADIIVLTSETAKSFRINDSGNYLLKGLTMNGTAENPSIRILGKNLFDIHIDKETGNKTVNTYITKSIRVSAINNDVSVSSAIWRMSFTYLDGKMDYVMDNGAGANYFSKTIKATEENPIVSIGYRSTYILSGSYDVQIELGTIETEFEPYIPMQEVMLPYTFEEGDSLVLEDGIVKTFIGGVETDITDTSWGMSILNLKTNYPNTTILCDANCNITYKADTANAYYNLRQAILNLGGTI